MDICVNDHIILKKPHPCGCREFKVNRVGMDFKIECCGCHHEVMVARSKIEKSIKIVLKADSGVF